MDATAKQIERIIILYEEVDAKKKHRYGLAIQPWCEFVVGDTLQSRRTGSKRSADKRHPIRCQFTKINFRLNARL